MKILTHRCAVANKYIITGKLNIRDDGKIYITVVSIEGHSENNQVAINSSVTAKKKKNKGKVIFTSYRKTQ